MINESFMIRFGFCDATVKRLYERFIYFLRSRIMCNTHCVFICWPCNGFIHSAKIHKSQKTFNFNIVMLPIVQFLIFFDFSVLFGKNNEMIFLQLECKCYFVHIANFRNFGLNLTTIKMIWLKSNRS